jgi:hypothetical protein
MTAIENKIEMNDNNSIASDDSWEETYYRINTFNRKWDSLFGDHDHLQFFKKQRKTKKGHWTATYFQTYGGGPEGGYIERVFWNAEDKIEKRELYRVERSWGNPFSVTYIPDKKIKNEVTEDEGFTTRIKAVPK